MKKRYFISSIFHALLLLVLVVQGCENAASFAVKSGDNLVTFYEVPLVCGADTNIGCGSRIKPLFIAVESEEGIIEAWSNRQGTVIGIVWNSSMTDASERDKIMMTLFENNSIEATSIVDESKSNELAASMTTEKWYKGMEVDQLSIEEAGYIANQQVTFAMGTGLITKSEADSIKIAIEDYFKVELVKVRALNELVSEETRNGWMNDCVVLATKYVGEERAQKMLELYKAEIEKESCEKESCCDEEK